MKRAIFQILELLRSAGSGISGYVAAELAKGKGLEEVFKCSTKSFNDDFNEGEGGLARCKNDCAEIDVNLLRDVYQAILKR